MRKTLTAAIVALGLAGCGGTTITTSTTTTTSTAPPLHDVSAYCAPAVGALISLVGDLHAYYRDGYDSTGTLSTDANTASQDFQSLANSMNTSGTIYLGVATQYQQIALLNESGQDIRQGGSPPPGWFAYFKQDCALSWHLQVGS